MNKLIIANWKENPENIEVAKELLYLSSSFKKESFSLMHAVPSIFAPVLVGGNASIILQDISKFESGSHTGEVSWKQAKGFGIAGSIVGHSERRISRINIHGDTDVEVNQKLRNLLNNNMFACLCVGESKREGEWKSILEKQIRESLKDVPTNENQNLVIAYEPIWAIGGNAIRSATTLEIEESINFIKSAVPSVKVLYGGSVDESNAKQILEMSCVDGVLVGRASADKNKWGNLLKMI